MPPRTYTRLYMTNGRMDRQTDRCKAIYPLFFEGRHKKAKCYKVTYLSMLFSRSSSIFSSIMVHLNCLQASITSSVKMNIFAIILTLSLICHFETAPNSKKLRTTNEMWLLTHYHTMPHFDALKINSCGKNCEKIACNMQFFLFSQCFLPYMVLIFHFKCTLKCCLQFVSIWTSLQFCRLVTG